MPGPGPHLLYCLSTSVGLMHVSCGRFSIHHSMVYAMNGFVGPDLGSVFEAGFGRLPWLSSRAMSVIHHPLYYVLTLGLPLTLFYYFLSRRFHARHSGKMTTAVTPSGGLTLAQCFILITAGSLSHFFLDNLFQEDGRTEWYMWVISTGWFDLEAPVDLPALLVTGSLSFVLVAGFAYVNRAKRTKAPTNRAVTSLVLLGTVAALYCLWCVRRLYWLTDSFPPVGEEADLGVIVFMTCFFFVPHFLCVLSMNTAEDLEYVLPSTNKQEEA